MAQHRAELGAEHDPAVGQGGVVERLDPDAVARQQEPTRRLIPNSKSKHAVEGGESGSTVGLDLMEDHLSVTAGIEVVSSQERPQLAEVVDLAVVYDLGLAFGAGSRRRL